MATSVPLPFKPQVPVTPPPDQHTFTKGSFTPYPPQPQQLPRNDFSRAAYEATGVPPPQQNAMPSPMPKAPENIPPTQASYGQDAGAAAASLRNVLRDPSVDQRYVAMASRIASYYQQRCQAIANFQQQRCQAWANAQRQKCQEMTQAAMLIIAWYIRDRISRRRRRQRRSFKRGLKQNARISSRNRITKGEMVRKWVLDLPLGAAASASPQTDNRDERQFLDKEEEAFEMDRQDATPDKDTQLFNVADSMIKSQLARIDVPLLGLLSFDESEDESEFDSEADDEAMDDDNFEQADGAEDVQYDEDGEGEDVSGEGPDSKSVHPGTSNKDPTKSSCIA